MLFLQEKQQNAKIQCPSRTVDNEGWKTNIHCRKYRNKSTQQHRHTLWAHDVHLERLFHITPKQLIKRAEWGSINFVLRHMIQNLHWTKTGRRKVIFHLIPKVLSNLILSRSWNKEVFFQKVASLLGLPWSRLWVSAMHPCIPWVGSRR